MSEKLKTSCPPPKRHKSKRAWHGLQHKKVWGSIQQGLDYHDRAVEDLRGVMRKQASQVMAYGRNDDIERSRLAH